MYCWVNELWRYAGQVLRGFVAAIYCLLQFAKRQMRHAMLEDTIIDLASFQSTGGVQFTGASDVHGQVVIDVTGDLEGQANGRLRLAAEDLDGLIPLLQRFQRASA